MDVKIDAFLKINHQLQVAVAGKDLPATCPDYLQVNISTPGSVTVVNTKPACRAIT
jgi:hypothetical protein